MQNKKLKMIRAFTALLIVLAFVGGLIPMANGETIHYSVACMYVTLFFFLLFFGPHMVVKIMQKPAPMPGLVISENQWKSIYENVCHTHELYYDQIDPETKRMEIVRLYEDPIPGKKIGRLIPENKREKKTYIVRKNHVHVS